MFGYSGGNRYVRHPHGPSMHFPNGPIASPELIRRPDLAASERPATRSAEATLIERQSERVPASDWRCPLRPKHAVELLEA